MYGVCEVGEMEDNLLFSELPYASAVDESCFGTRRICWSCFLKEGLHRCVTCKTASYCGKECQRKDWKTQHKEECVIFKKVKDEISRKELGANIELRLTARILIRKSKDGGIQDPEGQAMLLIFAIFSLPFQI